MPTVITHALIGLASTSLPAKRPLRLWLLTVCCALFPDFDGVGFYLGVPYGHMFGHRGIFHSLAFALLLGFGLAYLFLRRRQQPTKSWIGYGLLLSLVTASHGLADALTNGGLGVALLAPFDQHRYFFSATPIAVAPLSPRLFLTQRMLAVLVSEACWVWLPLLALTASFHLLRAAWLRNATGSALGEKPTPD